MHTQARLIYKRKLIKAQFTCRETPKSGAITWGQQQQGIPTCGPLGRQEEAPVECESCHGRVVTSSEGHSLGEVTLQGTRLRNQYPDLILLSPCSALLGFHWLNPTRTRIQGGPQVWSVQVTFWEKKSRKWIWRDKLMFLKMYILI